MPALYLFGRRTIFAGDDLQPASFLTIVMRGFQSLFLLIPVFVHFIRETSYFISLSGEQDGSKRRVEYLFGGDNVYSDECESGAHCFPLFLLVYLIASVAHFIVSCAIEYIITQVASVGSPTEPHLRNTQLQPLLEKKWIRISLVGNLLVLTFVLISLLYKNPYFECRDIMRGDEYLSTGSIGGYLFWIPLILLILSQSGEFTFSAFALGTLLRKEKVCRFVAEGKRSGGVNRYHNDRQRHHELTEEMWDTRCRNWCQCAAFSTCFMFGGRELMDDMVGDYGDISRVLSDYLEDGGELDLVPSDIAVGFMMLQRIQQHRILVAQRNVLQEMKSEKLIQNFWATDTYSALPFDAGTRVGETASVITNSGIIERLEDGGGGIAQSPLILDDMLASAVQPVANSNILLLSDDGAKISHPLNHHATALTLQMSPCHDRDTSHWYETQERKILSRDDELDRLVLAEGARFARHALSIYTWVLYMYMYPTTGMIRLLFDRLSDCCKLNSRHEFENIKSVRTKHIDGDNSFHIHKNALLAHSGLRGSDLIYASFQNKYNQMPYCIVIDHKWKSVVLSIRGTLSLEDCLTDVLVDSEPLDDLGREYDFNGEGQYCHSGVLSCTKHIFNDLQRHRILDTLLLGIDAVYPHYTLRITGHSLGAGTATLLGYMMKRKFPNLRVTSISPPGGFITWRLAIECKEFVTSYVLDSDLVPRLSIDAMEHLRDEILDLIRRIKVPKIEIARTFFKNGTFCNQVQEDNPDFLADNNGKMLDSNESVSRGSTFYHQLEKFKETQNDRRKERGERQRLFPPGRIIHLVKTGERTSCCHTLANCVTCCTTNIGYEYTPVWVNNDDFSEIVVSPTMATDHFPNRVCLELESVAKTFGIDTSTGSSPEEREEANKARATMTNDVGIF